MGQETSCKPASPADYRCSQDMPASGVKAVGRVGESDGNAEADAPGRNRHELGLNGLHRSYVSRQACTLVSRRESLLLLYIQGL